MRIAFLHNLPSGGAMRYHVTGQAQLRGRHRIEMFIPEGAERRFLDPESTVDDVHVYSWDRPQLDHRLSPAARLVRYYVRLGRLFEVYRRIAADVDERGFDTWIVGPCNVLYSPPALLHTETPSAFVMHEAFRYVYEPAIDRPYRSRLRQLLGATLYGHYKSRLRRLDRRSAKCATRVVTNSEFTAGELRKIYGIEAHVEYPEIDAEGFSPGGERGDYVLSVGGIEPLKGFDFLVRGIGRLPSSIRPPLVLVGDRAYEPEQTFLLGLAAQCGVDLRIRLRVTESEIREAYRCARVFVYAPVREPLGYAALEAQASGTPVVGVDEGGVRETVVDGETGLLTERDPLRFAAALERLLVDRDLARRMGAAGREHVLTRWVGTGFGDRIDRHLVAAAQSRVHQG